MASGCRGTDEEARALRAYVKLLRAAESVTGRLAARVQQAGLTWSQFGALEALLHLGPLCQRDLGEKLLKSTGNITMVVDNLERRGLVRRERRRDDRRYVTVHLTDEGRALIERLFPEHAAAIAAEMRALTPEEQDELGRLCRKLGLKTED
jgi:MarR family transcriptional regulator, 2-MHQ and catechol-resistance regulon repressor